MEKKKQSWKKKESNFRKKNKKKQRGKVGKKICKKTENTVNYCCRCGGTVIPPHHLDIVIINSSHYTIFLRVKMCFSHVNWINFKWIFFLYQT